MEGQYLEAHCEADAGFNARKAENEVEQEWVVQTAEKAGEALSTFFLRTFIA